MKKKVLLAASISQVFRQKLLANAYEIIEWDGQEIPTDIKGLVTSNKLPLDQASLQPLTNLKWIGRLGSGIDIIDTQYCTKNKIAFASSPAGIAQSVGEHCVGLLVSLLKNISKSAIEINEKNWIREPNRGWELANKTIGLIGYGHTGKAFAKKLASWDVNIIAYDKYINNFSTDKVKEVSLSELQQSADIISFHVPLNQETYHYYSQSFIEKCKKHILINTSRGAIVNTTDLLLGLENAKVEGAALDVIENEESLKSVNAELWNTIEKLLKHNVVLTPHIAGYSHDAIEKMSAELIEKLEDVI